MAHYKNTRGIVTDVFPEKFVAQLMCDTTRCKITYVGAMRKLIAFFNHNYALKVHKSLIGQHFSLGDIPILVDSDLRCAIDAVFGHTRMCFECEDSLPECYMYLSEYTSDIDTAFDKVYLCRRCAMEE